MARVTKPLTNTEVNQAKPKDKEYNLIDGEGLMLRVKPTGTKSWLFNYYHPITKKRKNYSIGLYPTITIIDARKIRLELKRLISNGIDPKESKDAEMRIAQIATSQTLRLIAESWFMLRKQR